MCHSLDMSLSAVYAAYSRGITILALPVCVESPSTSEKRKLWSVCIVDVRVVQVETDWLAFNPLGYVFSPARAFVIEYVG